MLIIILAPKKSYDDFNSLMDQHVKKQRITEWPVEFLSRPKRTVNTIPDFLSPEAPANRLDILRGLAK